MSLIYLPRNGFIQNNLSENKPAFGNCEVQQEYTLGKWHMWLFLFEDRVAEDISKGGFAAFRTAGGRSTVLLFVFGKGPMAEGFTCSPMYGGRGKRWLQVWDWGPGNTSTGLRMFVYLSIGSSQIVHSGRGGLTETAFGSSTALKSSLKHNTSSIMKRTLAI